MKKPTNNQNSNKNAIFGYANYLYLHKGMQAVYDYANTLPKTLVRWGHCNGCDCQSPSIDRECMVCGQSVNFEYKVDIDEDSIRIMNGNTEIVGWHKDEWEEDPGIVVSIANAIKLAYTEPEELMKRLKSVHK